MAIPAGATLQLDSVGFDNDIYQLVFNASTIGGPVNIIAR